MNTKLTNEAVDFFTKGLGTIRVFDNEAHILTGINSGGEHRWDNMLEYYQSVQVIKCPKCGLSEQLAKLVPENKARYKLSKKAQGIQATTHNVAIPTNTHKKSY